MKKKKLFTFIPLLGLAGLLAFSSAQIISSSIANAVNIEEAPFSDTYFVNDEITIPDLELDVEGQKVLGTKYIIYPNGRTYQKESFTPTEMGYYTISYRAGKVKEDYRIYVAQKKYYVTGDGSASWTAHPKTPSKQSLVVTLAAGSTFHFDEIINLKELESTHSVFSFYPVTAEPGATDANTLIIRLTDVYDDSRYIQYEIDASRQGYSHNTVYMRVGGDNQTPTGIEAALNKVHVGTIFGYPYNCNFYCCTPTMGKYTERQYISNRISLFFDYKNMRGLSLANANGHDLICDLDDSAYFSEFWEGFTTGECKVSAWFENMMAPTATICVTNIAEKNLETRLLIDETQPNLVIEDIFENMPDAIINQKYRFLKAEGSDQYSGVIGAKIRVYRDYYGKKIDVPTLEDGFIPNKLGTYYIEYSCTDYSENEVKKVYEIQCVNEERSFNISLVPGYASNGYVGEIVSLANVSIEGTVGPAITTTYITSPNGEKVVIEDYKYTPLKSGQYKVTYEAIDFIGTIKKVSYDLNITVSEAPIINEEAQLLPYYIAGYEYELPLIKAIDFNKEGNPEVISKIKIIDGDKEIELENDKVTFEADDQQIRNVTVSYVCENEKAQNSKSYNIQVVTTSTDGFIHMDKYWHGNSAQASATNSEITISSSTSGSSTFVNNLAANEFEFNFIFRNGLNNFSSFNIYLTDSLNENEKVKISYLANNEIPDVYVNDDFEFHYVGNGLFNDGNQFITYNNSTHKIQTNNTVLIPVKRYTNGEKFLGFSSGSIYLTIEFVNPDNNNVAVSIIDINGQEMSNTKYDYIRPRAVMDDDYGGSKNIHEVINLCSATAYDVLDPCPKISLSAFNENNEYVDDINGQSIKDVRCDISHQFRADDYGTYRISYHITDYDDNSAYFTYVISIYDKNAPEMSFLEANPNTANVGDTVKFVEPQLSDDLSSPENIKLVIYVIMPTGLMVEAKNNSYRFEKAGKYIIRYLAIDEANNISIVDFIIEVSEVK